MRLISATLRNYRVHRELRVTFDAGRTLVGGPNEAGKSTLIEAIHRGLFLKAKGNTEQHRAMRSDLYPGHPEVELGFESGGRTYQLTKRFGTTGTTSLASSNGKPLVGDAAEVELARILGVDGGLAGKAVLAQWAHLWVWQGKSGDDPSAHATERQGELIQHLQKHGAAAALQSEQDARVAGQFAEAYSEIYTPGNKPRAGSELERAEQALAAANETLAKARERLSRLESAAAEVETGTRQLTEITQSLSVLEKQRVEIDARGQRLAELRSLEKDQTFAARSATERSAELQETEQRILKLASTVRDLEKEFGPRQDQLKRAEVERDSARVALDTATREATQAAEAVRGVRRRYELASAQVRLGEFAERCRKLEEKHARILVLRAESARLESERAQLPAVDAALLRKLQRFEANVAESRAALNAMAAGVELLQGDQPVRVGDSPLEVGGRRVLTEAAELRIGDGVRLRISPGGGTTLAEARQAEVEARGQLQAALDALGLTSVADAAAASGKRDELSRQIQRLGAELEGLSGGQLEAELASGRTELANISAAVERLAVLVPDAPQPSDPAAAQALARELERSLGGADDAEVRAKAAHGRLAQSLESADEALAKLRAGLEAERSRLAGARAQLELLVQTHGDDATRTRALVEAETSRLGAVAQLTSTQSAIAELQPDLLAGDSQRIRRATEAQGQEKHDLLTRIAVGRTMLSNDGTDDPSAGCAVAAAQARQAKEQRDRVKRRADAIALLDQLFREEQRSLAEQFTRPLADRISGYLQCLFGAGARAQVRLENNEFTGLQLYRPGVGGGAVDFGALSGGAREQTAAAVRLAMADVLAADHDGCLPVVFDDAFAFSDPERVNQLQRMLDLAASRGLQVIVLTCNPADYAALGARQVQLRREHPAAVASGSDASSVASVRE